MNDAPAFLGPPDWVNDYIGLPYVLNGRERRGLDCWGLISLVWREKRGIQIPDFQAPHDADLMEVMQAVADNMPEAIRQARAVAVEAPVDWDFVVCYRHKLACHVGLYIGGGILHTHPTTSGSVWEPESDSTPTINSVLLAMARLILIRNPLSLADREEVELAPGRAVIDWLQEFHPTGCGAPLRFFVNGAELDLDDLDLIPEPDDDVRLVACPAGPAIIPLVIAAVITAVVSTALHRH